MKLSRFFLILAATASSSGVHGQESKDSPPSNLDPDKLVAWCIVPFDAKKRNPAERATMLRRLGMRRCAYDWRREHVAEFEEEIRQYREHGIEFFAFWDAHEEAFKLFKKHDLHPQIWRTAPSPAGKTQDAKVAAAARAMEGLAKRTAELGCKLGLYNHGGWGGEPANLVAVCQRLRDQGHRHVGIVYNWHHGHGHLADWAEALALMKPYLLCLNLNGMNSGAKPKILALAQGTHELAMLKVVRESGYDGPVGILDHQGHLDAEETLRDNLVGLQWLRKELKKSGSGGAKPNPGARAATPPAPPATSSKPRAVDSAPGFGKALAGGLVVEGKAEWREPPITVECQVKLADARGYNILVASDTKASQAHWEIFSMNGSGQLTAYLPGAIPDHVQSAKVITDRKWHQVAMQYDKDRVRLWVDGEVVSDQALALKTGRRVVPGGLAFARLVEGGLGLRGAIDAVRIRKGIHKPFGGGGVVLGEWDFENLSQVKNAGSSGALDRKPLEPEANPYWQEPINRDRIYDFYAKQARSRPANLTAFPGLDGGNQGHWGNQNDQTTWKDGRVREMDHGSMVSGVFRGAGKTIPRAVALKVSEGICAVFDLDTGRFEAAWKGPLAKWSDVRRGLMHGIPIGSNRAVVLKNAPARDEEARYLGLVRDGERVAFLFYDGEPFYRSASLVDGRVVVSDTAEFAKSGKLAWPTRLVTRGRLGTGQPYAIDTLTLPSENPWKALLFVSGLDFLSATRLAICTLHGDVWLCDIVKPDLSELRWKRFAAGLHQPLGLKVSNNAVHVRCRDQIVALHDLDENDEADFYECVSSAQQTSPGGHDFITGLERDSHDRWYFASGSQGLCQVSPDGERLQVVATGLRNPNGLAISPDGEVILTNVQEGNWTPASAICDVSRGGHFGAGGPRDGERGYVPPMLYLPRGVDNSSGGQAYIDSERWGPVHGQWIHFAGGFAKHFLILREETASGSQAAAVVLPGSFLSGAHRGRFSPFDGHLYVAGAQGWGNYGLRDGCLQRVRFTGDQASYPYPTAFETRENGVLLTFAAAPSEPLAESGKWFAQNWNYRYGPGYGSPEYSVTDPRRVSHDRLEIRGVHRVEDGRQLFLEIPQLRPVDQLHLHFDGAPRLELFATLNELGEPYTKFPGYKPVLKTWGTSPNLTGPATNDPAVLMMACAACHHATQRVVGPSLADIRQRYPNNPEGIVKWAMKPQNKNPQLPPMPSFRFLGEERLRIIADAILAGPPSK